MLLEPSDRLSVSDVAICCPAKVFTSASVRSVKSITPVLLLYEILLVAEIEALALAVVWYRLTAPSDKSLVVALAFYLLP